MVRKKDIRGSSKGVQIDSGEICYVEILLIAVGRKTIECLVKFFMNLLEILYLVLVQISYRLIEEWLQRKKSWPKLYIFWRIHDLWSWEPTYFGTALSTASKIIYEVCKATTEHLGSKKIRLPRKDNEIIQKTSEIESKYGMIQAFGCIDDTHVPTLRHIENFQGYYCKMFFSLNVQAVCDYRGVFMDVDTADDLTLSTMPKCFATQK